MTAFGSTDGTGLFCAATEGPACFNSHPSGFSLLPGRYTNTADYTDGMRGALTVH